MGKKGRNRGRWMWGNFPLELFVRISFPFPWSRSVFPERILIIILACNGFFIDLKLGIMIPVTVRYGLESEGTLYLLS